MNEKPAAGLWRNNPETPEGKYLVKRRDGSVVEWPNFVIGAKDPAAPAALFAYAAKARELGMNDAYYSDVEQLAASFDRYRVEVGEGDPDRGRHRPDDPATIAEMRRGGLGMNEMAAAAPREEPARKDAHADRPNLRLLSEGHPAVAEALSVLRDTFSRWSQKGQTDNYETQIDAYGKRILSEVIRELTATRGEEPAPPPPLINTRADTARACRLDGRGELDYRQYAIRQLLSAVLKSDDAPCSSSEHEMAAKVALLLEKVPTYPEICAQWEAEAASTALPEAPRAEEQP